MNDHERFLQVFQAYLEGDKGANVAIPFKASWIKVGGSELVDLFFAQQTQSSSLPDTFWMALRTLNREVIINLLTAMPMTILEKMNWVHIRQIDPVLEKLFLEISQRNENGRQSLEPRD